LDAVSTPNLESVARCLTVLSQKPSKSAIKSISLNLPPRYIPTRTATLYSTVKPATFASLVFIGLQHGYF